MRLCLTFIFEFYIIMIKVLTVILSCEKNMHLWPSLLNKNIDNLLIICGKSLDENYIFDCNDQILYVNCNDGYEGLPEKMIYAYNAIRGYKKFDSITHILKIDDHDTIVSKEVIDNIEINGQDCLNRRHYVGQHIYGACMGGHHIGRCGTSPWNNRLYEGENGMYASGGYSYILSRNALNIICNTYTYSDKERIRKEHIYEDLMVAMILKRSEIFPVQAYYGIKSTDPLYKRNIPTVKARKK